MLNEMKSDFYIFYDELMIRDNSVQARKCNAKLIYHIFLNFINFINFITMESFLHDNVRVLK